MHATLFALTALVLYAIANTIIEKSLGGVSPLANTTYIYLPLLLVSAPLLIFRDRIGLKLTMPESGQAKLLFCCAVLFFFADLAWFKAYHSKGRLEQITATFLAFPILTTFMKGMSSGIAPTTSDWISWLIVAIGLIVSIRQPF